MTDGITEEHFGAHERACSRDECIASGMDDFITTPFDPERFLETVAQNLAALGLESDAPGPSPEPQI
ncbi:MAG: hypothetical protein P4L73_05415 [Caulobacteraceae bacterium]|nr:hypothetical protein [Caulobacteraceae bacterium]